MIIIIKKIKKNKVKNFNFFVILIKSISIFFKR